MDQLEGPWAKHVACHWARHSDSSQEFWNVRADKLRYPKVLEVPPYQISSEQAQAEDAPWGQVGPQDRESNTQDHRKHSAEWEAHTHLRSCGTQE